MDRHSQNPFCFESLDKRLLMAAATVDFGDVHQTIDGFGASSAWMWGSIPQAALDQLYNPQTGAGLSLLRSRITPAGWSSEWEMMQQTNAYGVRVWSTPWTQPREWKSNHDTNNGGTLLASHYQDYANLLADYVADMQGKGVPMYAVSLQNEPNWKPDYESTIWTADEFAAFLPYVGQTFASRGLTTKILLPESLNWEFSLAAKVMADPNLAKYVGILAAHNYGETPGSYKPVAIAGSKPVWETEFTSFATSSELSTALDTANDIHQAMTDANAAAWHYWWLNAGDNAAVMGSGWQPTKRLWAMGQYSRFVRPGWVRVGGSDDGGLDVTSFKDPASGKFAIVVVNSGGTAITEKFTLKGLSAASVTPYVTSAAEDLARHASIPVAGGTGFTQTIGANSIITFYGVSSAAPTLQAPSALKAGVKYGSASSQIALSWTDNSTAETGYAVERSTNGSNWTVLTDSLPANTTSYLDTGRAENTRYYYRVKARQNSAASAYSAVASASTILIAPSQWGITGTRTTTGITLKWSTGSAVSTGVTLDRSTDGVTWMNVANLSGRATTYADTIPAYRADQLYFYRVRNTAGAVKSAFSPWNSGVQAPTNFRASAVTSNAVTFAWSMPTRGTSGAWIEQYNSTTSSWARVSPTSLQSADGAWRLTGLKPSTTYQFRLRLGAAADSVYSAYATLGVSTAAPSTAPVVWYKADESAGATLGDASDNGISASLVGSYARVAGVTGNAVKLTGGYADLPDGVVAGLGDFTIAAWLNVSTLTSWSRLFDFGTGTGTYMYFTPRAGSTGLPQFGISTSGPAGKQAINSSVAIAANKWTHVAITLSGNTATLYLDGVVAGQNANVTLRPASMGVTTQNYIGKSQSSADANLSGSVDDFRVYERPLSVAEVKSLATPPTGKLAGTPFGTAGSYAGSGNTFAKAFDGDLNTFFDSQVASGAVAGLDLGSPRTVGSVKFAPRSGWAGRMVGGVFQVSNDASFASFITVGTIRSTPPVGTLTTLSFATSGAAYRYVRYVSPNQAYGNVAELQFYSTGGTALSVTRLAGVTIGTSGSFNGSGNTIARALDGELDTFYDGATPSDNWVGLDLGVGPTPGTVYRSLSRSRHSSSRSMTRPI